MRGGPRHSAASITLAQARVLHYLPTDVTFAVIADKLGSPCLAAKGERAERLAARSSASVRSGR